MDIAIITLCILGISAVVYFVFKKENVVTSSMGYSEFIEEDRSLKRD